MECVKYSLVDCYILSIQVIFHVCWNGSHSIFYSGEQLEILIKKIENTNDDLQWWSSRWSITCVQIWFYSNWIICWICCTFRRSCILVIFIWRSQSLLSMTNLFRSMIIRLKISSLRTVYESTIFNSFSGNWHTILTEMLLIELLVF